MTLRQKSAFAIAFRWRDGCCWLPEASPPWTGRFSAGSGTAVPPRKTVGLEGPPDLLSPLGGGLTAIENKAGQAGHSTS